jgi:hypothetical protein
MKVDRAIDDVREAEADFAKRLRVVGERHAVEHDLYHLGHTLSAQCAEHLRKLQPFADQYGAASTADDADQSESPGLLESFRRKTSEILGGSEATGLLLLADLRENYLVAQRVEISWVVLIQVAKAVHDNDLLTVASACHAESEMAAKWLRTKIKVACPQVLAVS